MSYAELVGNLATSYCLRPGPKDWGRTDGDDEVHTHACDAYRAWLKHTGRLTQKCNLSRSAWAKGSAYVC